MTPLDERLGLPTHQSTNSKLMGKATLLAVSVPLATDTVILRR